MHLRKLILVAFFSLAICYGTGIYFDYRFKKNFATLFFNSTDTILDKTKNYDVILLGNSRVHFGLNPYYIDSISKLNSYNFAIGGSDADMLSLNSSLYLQNHNAPAYAIIGSDISFLTDNKAIKSQFHFFFYLSNDIIYSTLKKHHPTLFLARYLSFMKYSFFDEYNRFFVLKNKAPFKSFDHNIYKGFINPHEGNATEPIINFTAPDEMINFSQENIDIVKSSINKLAIAGTKIIIISPPLKGSISANKKINFTRADSVFKSIATANGAIFLNMNNLITDNQFFTDDLHLNEPGTRLFSKQVGLLIDSLNRK